MAVGEGTGGAKYEKEVKKVIRAAAKKTKHLSVVPDGGSAFANQGSDLKLKFHNMKINIEIKMSPRAQMGGSAINYLDEKFFFPKKASTDDMDPDAKLLIEKAVKNLQLPLEKFLKFIRGQDIIDINGKVVGLPIRCTMAGWNAAQAKGLLKPLNLSVSYDAKFIINHYAKKDVNYIQIGKAGFFYLGKNPLDLPIPQLQGDVDIELRLARGGPTQNTTYKTTTIGANIRAQARLKTKNKSDFSLDNPDHILMLFGK